MGFFSPRGIIQNYRPRFFPTNLRSGEGNMELMFNEKLTYSGAGMYNYVFRLFYTALKGEIGNGRWMSII